MGSIGYGVISYKLGWFGVNQSWRWTKSIVRWRSSRCHKFNQTVSSRTVVNDTSTNAEGIPGHLAGIRASGFHESQRLWTGFTAPNKQQGVYQCFLNFISACLLQGISSSRSPCSNPPVVAKYGSAAVKMRLSTTWLLCRKVAGLFGERPGDE